MLFFLSTLDNSIGRLLVDLYQNDKFWSIWNVTEPQIYCLFGVCLFRRILSIPIVQNLVYSSFSKISLLLFLKSYIIPASVGKGLQIDRASVIQRLIQSSPTKCPPIKPSFLD